MDILETETKRRYDKRAERIKNVSMLNFSPGNVVFFLLQIESSLAKIIAV